jgi:hypothetical protein
MQLSILFVVVFCLFVVLPINQAKFVDINDEIPAQIDEIEQINVDTIELKKTVKQLLFSVINFTISDSFES